MNEQLKKRQFIVIALMLFSMFFGAGNFIFPPMVGLNAGTNFYPAILSFCLTAVALPVLGVAATARAGDLRHLASRVDPLFASIFLFLIYISIGPALAIPRAGNMPFEIAVKPFISQANETYWLVVYGLIYFTLNWYVCLKPSKMLEILGKWLTPGLLILLLVFFIASLVMPLGDFGIPNGDYLTHAISKSFIEGYQTMDALAALVFGIIVTNSIKDLGIKDKERLGRMTIRTGILAGLILMATYFMLGYLGATAGIYGESENGAILLSKVSNHFFGNAGIFVLGLAFLLACFTTTVGLIGAVSSYFEEILPKISYKSWVAIWSAVSFLIANLGLSQIIKFSVPVLIAIYPVAIILIILSLINKIINSDKYIYRACVYTAAFIGILNGLDTAGLFGEGFHVFLVENLPLYDSMLGWVIPTGIAFTLSYLYYIIFEKKI